MFRGDFVYQRFKGQGTIKRFGHQSNNGRFKAVERNAANIRATERLLLITCGYLVIRNEKYWKYAGKENPVRVVLTIRQVYNILSY